VCSDRVLLYSDSTLLPLDTMIAQRAGISTRALASQTSFVLRSRAHGRVSCRALPVPQSDVIEKSDADVLVSLEERFKMADIDG
jgi:hypothetical protein